MSKTKKSRGRPRTPRKRLGKFERRLVDKLIRKIRSFKFQTGDKNRRETSLNSRLIKLLRKVDGRVVNKDIASVTFVGQTYRPECTLKSNGPYVLFAVECKKLHDQSAKRLFKEGLSQANLYLTTSKVVALVLYDFTRGKQYKGAFGRGNTVSSRMARRLREEAGLCILVV